jgi:hypothetical protein
LASLTLGAAIPHHWETLMPLFTVTMKAGRAADEKNAISRAIHEASVKAGYPDDDMFQRFLCLEQDDRSPLCLVVLPTASIRSAEPEYSLDVTTWEEIRVPPAMHPTTRK